LNRRCGLRVVEGSDGAAIEPGQVIIAPGGQQMRVAATRQGAVIQITDDPAERNCKPAVDYLFRSLAEEFGDRALGVVLTGMGDDGTRGARALKARGATVVAQDEDSSVVFGMPKSVIDAGLADIVLPMGEIAEQLQLVACQEALA
jgi:two-component system chemotaxis response regulator CheB